MDRENVHASQMTSTNMFSSVYDSDNYYQPTCILWITSLKFYNRFSSKCKTNKNILKHISIINIIRKAEWQILVNEKWIFSFSDAVDYTINTYRNFIPEFGQIWGWMLFMQFGSHIVWSKQNRVYQKTGFFYT